MTVLKECATGARYLCALTSVRIFRETQKRSDPLGFLRYSIYCSNAGEKIRKKIKDYRPEKSSFLKAKFKGLFSRAQVTLGTKGREMVKFRLKKVGNKALFFVFTSHIYVHIHVYMTVW